MRGELVTTHLIEASVVMHRLVRPRDLPGRAINGRGVGHQGGSRCERGGAIRAAAPIDQAQLSDLGRIARKPFVALDHPRDWSRILAVLDWFRDHPNSDFYLRQLDIEGVDTKFIESRNPLLAKLLAVVVARAAEPQPSPAS
jgi:hypothetical protein